MEISRGFPCWRAASKASSPQGYQSTGLSMCWRRYALVYLALQIRQNSRQISQNTETMRLSFENEIRTELNGFRQSIVAGEKLSSIWNRGLAEETLDQDERDRFELLLTNVVAMLTARFYAHERGFYDLGRRIPYFSIA